MLDFSFVGKQALIIQFEDLISFIGWNAAEFILTQQRSNPKTKKEDRLLSYMNRFVYDPTLYVEKQTGIKCTMNDLMISPVSLSPTMLYAFRMFSSSVRNGMKNLYIHSNVYSKLIEQYVKQTLPDVKYVYGDIIPVIQNNANCTYTTSDPNNIRKCVNVGVPFVLVIADDFAYVSEIISDEGLLKQLDEKNVLVQYTSIVTGGFVPNTISIGGSNK